MCNWMQVGWDVSIFNRILTISAIVRGHNSLLFFSGTVFVSAALSLSDFSLNGPCQ